jgi:hypothetical protein
MFCKQIFLSWSRFIVEKSRKADVEKIAPAQKMVAYRK